MSEFWLVKDKQQLRQRIEFFQRYLESEWNWEYPVEWKVKRYIPKRSLSQNALFHVWCREMAEHFKSKGADITEEKMKELIDELKHSNNMFTTENETLEERLKSKSAQLHKFASQCQANALKIAMLEEILSDYKYQLTDLGANPSV